MTGVFFDTETGGTDEDRHPIIQLAAIAVHIDTWQELAAFERKIQFNEADCEPDALKVNQYDPEVWAREAVPGLQVAREFSRWLQPYREIWQVPKDPAKSRYRVARMIAHNAKFDIEFLRVFHRRFKDAGYGGTFLPADLRARCTMQRALWWADEHRIDPPPENFQVEGLCKYFGIRVKEGEAHDALNDVRLTIQIARKLVEYGAGGSLFL
jgi:DNA polymerase III epsilon subunit-like protein